MAYDHRPIACHALPAVVAPGIALISAPLDRSADHYSLVSAPNCLGEGTRGFRSDGVERHELPSDCGPIR